MYVTYMPLDPTHYCIDASLILHFQALPSLYPSEFKMLVSQIYIIFAHAQAPPNFTLLHLNSISYV